jgi:hypothetical protein
MHPGHLSQTTFIARMARAAVLLAAAAVVSAQTELTPDNFESHVGGKTPAFVAFTACVLAV